MSTGRTQQKLQTDSQAVEVEFNSTAPWGLQKCYTRGLGTVEKNGDTVSITAPDLKTQKGSSSSCLSSAGLNLKDGKLTAPDVVEGNGTLKLLKNEEMYITIKGDKSFQSIQEGEAVKFKVQETKMGYTFDGSIKAVSDSAPAPKAIVTAPTSSSQQSTTQEGDKLSKSAMALGTVGFLAGGYAGRKAAKSGFNYLYGKHKEGIGETIVTTVATGLGAVIGGGLGLTLGKKIG